jgi:lysophospholipase L1-like esterase
MRAFVALAVLCVSCKSTEVAAAPAHGANAGPFVATVSDAPPTPSPVQPSRRTYVVAALGDSLTDQKVAGGGYLKRLGELCPESRFVSFGKGGDMVNQMRRRFVHDVFEGAPDGNDGFTHLIVFGGVNDLYSDLTAGRTVPKISADLSAIYAEGHRRGVEVVAVTVTPWGGFKKYFNETRSAATGVLNRWIMAQRGTGADFVVDAFPLLSCGDRDFLCEAYARPFKDGLHFGKEGHARLGDALHREVFADCR